MWVFTQRKSYRKGKLSKDRIDRLNGIGFEWTPQIGRSRKRKAPPSTRNQSLSRRERVSSPCSNVQSPSAIDGARGVEPNEFKGEGRGATSSALSLKVPSKRSDHNRATESDDEFDEIGALIYDQINDATKTILSINTRRRVAADGKRLRAEELRDLSPREILQRGLPKTPPQTAQEGMQETHG